MSSAEPMTVLNVDDNITNRYIITRTLRTAGFEVIEAASGKEVFELAGQCPSVILLDVNLPDMNGFEVCKLLKANPASASIPVIHLTASFANTENRVVGLDGGADAYLWRPVDPKELVSTIHAVLRTREAERVARSMSQEWQATFDAIGDAACVVDRNGLAIRCNRSMSALFGQPPESIRGALFHSLLEAALGPVDLPSVERWRISGERGMTEHRTDEKWYRITADPIVGVGGDSESAIYIVADITALRKAAQDVADKQTHIEELNDRLRRSMRETHHRVKNNLQIIAAMVDLQVLDGTEMVPTAELVRLTAHIKTLAAVHDLLTNPANDDLTVEWVSAKLILDKMLPYLRGSAVNRGIEARIDDARLTVRQATSLALVANEVVSNALKHSHGDVLLTMTVEDDIARLQVCDDGPGFASGFDPVRDANTGIELVNNLSRWDLGGRVDYGNRDIGGACVTITLPIVQRHGP